MVSGKLAASGDYRAIRQQLNDRPFVVRIDCAEPARARGRPARGRGGRVGRGRPATARLRVRSRDVAVAPAVAAARRAAARHPAPARRAARRLARERLRVPGEGVAPTWPRSSCSPSASSPAAAGSGSCSRSSRCPSSPASLFHVADSTTTSARVRRRRHGDARRLGDPAARHAPVRRRRRSGTSSATGRSSTSTLKPIARWRIVAPKLLASLARGRRPGRGRAGSWRSRVIEDGDARRRARDGRRAARGRRRVRGDLHVGGPRDPARAPDRPRLRLRLGGHARRVPRRHPLPQRPPLHARADPRRSTATRLRTIDIPLGAGAAIVATRPGRDRASRRSRCGSSPGWTCPDLRALTARARGRDGTRRVHVFELIVGALALVGLLAVVGLLWELVEWWLHRERDRRRSDARSRLGRGRAAEAPSSSRTRTPGRSRRPASGTG